MHNLHLSTYNYDQTFDMRRARPRLREPRP